MNISPFASELGVLQDFHRSETSVLAIHPELVAALRQTYLKVRRWGALDSDLAKLQVKGDNHEAENGDSNTAFWKQFTKESNDFMAQFNQETKLVANELSALGIELYTDRRLKRLSGTKSTLNR